MVKKLEKGDGIQWITIRADVIGEWYRKTKNTPSTIRYEDVVQNYLLNHLDKLRSEKVKSFWVEDKLRTSEKDKGLTKKYRPDVIVEYDDEIWLIEVKGYMSNSIGSVKQRNSAIKQVERYERRIRKLEWWGVDKNPEKIRKVLFWSYTTRQVKKIDLTETLEWPLD